MHWKIARDPYLAELCRVHGERAVWDAGFFMDDDPEDAPLDDFDWLCTPRPKRAVSGAAPVVLLSTGGFCPLHAGHLAMMAHARAAAEARGFDVLGGYLSPGHAAYLEMKCGDRTISTIARLRQCALAAAQSDWLSVDPWEALHCRVAVNFTDVTARLEGYLRAHVDPRISVLYVCGGDNARFAQAFRERGHCIVVGRPGAEAEQARWQAELAGLPHVTWVEGADRSASRALRVAPEPPAQRARLVVRLEDDRAVRTLGLTGLALFQRELLALLSRHADVRSVPLTARAPAEGVINLDAMQRTRHDLAVSRLFAPGGYESLGIVARPGAASITEQVAQIPAGRYVLADDDQMTGGTLSSVRALLPAQIVITGTELAVTHAADEDVVDARDFLLGADDGGLVIALPFGGVSRAPYLLPYVDPAARASIAASHAFSIDVWELNARTFARTSLRVQHLPASSRALFAAFGDVTLAELCSWHARKLRNLVALRPGSP